MLKKAELSDPNSCLNRAKDNELVFVLLERDPVAADTIRDWVRRRIRAGKNKPGDAQITEAATLAAKIDVGKGIAPGSIAEGARSEVYRAIDAEREHQDRRWGTIADHPHEVGGWMTIMRAKLAEAEAVWKNGDPDSLALIRQVVATGVACLEQHGATFP